MARCFLLLISLLIASIDSSPNCFCSSRSSGVSLQHQIFETKGYKVVNDIVLKVMKRYAVARAEMELAGKKMPDLKITKWKTLPADKAKYFDKQVGFIPNKFEVEITHDGNHAFFGRYWLNHGVVKNVNLNFYQVVESKINGVSQGKTRENTIYKRSLSHFYGNQLEYDICSAFVIALEKYFTALPQNNFSIVDAFLEDDKKTCRSITYIEYEMLPKALGKKEQIASQIIKREDPETVKQRKQLKLLKAGAQIDKKTKISVVKKLDISTKITTKEKQQVNPTVKQTPQNTETKQTVQLNNQKQEVKKPAQVNPQKKEEKQPVNQPKVQEKQPVIQQQTGQKQTEVVQKVEEIPVVDVDLTTTEGEDSTLEEIPEPTLITTETKKLIEEAIKQDVEIETINKLTSKPLPMEEKVGDVVAYRKKIYALIVSDGLIAPENSKKTVIYNGIDIDLDYSLIKVPGNPINQAQDLIDLAKADKKTEIDEELFRKYHEYTKVFERKLDFVRNVISIVSQKNQVEGDNKGLYYIIIYEDLSFKVLVKSKPPKTETVNITEKVIQVILSLDIYDMVYFKVTSRIKVTVREIDIFVQQDEDNFVKVYVTTEQFDGMDETINEQTKLAVEQYAKENNLDAKNIQVKKELTIVGQKKIIV